MSVSRSAEIDISLGVGGVTETVEVVGESPVVDRLERDQQRSVPGNALQPADPSTNVATDLLDFLPGIHQGSAYGDNATTANACSSTASRPATPSGLLLGLLQLQPDGGGPGGRPRRPRRIRLLHRRGRQHHHQVGWQPFTGLFDAYWTKGGFWQRQRRRKYVERTRPSATRSAINKRLDLPARSAVRSSRTSSSSSVRPALRAGGQPERAAQPAHRGQPTSTSSSPGSRTERQPHGQLPVGLLQPTGRVTASTPLDTATT